jgi:uncharacterized membrane protein YqaE (UPF0057 family)
MGIIIECIYTQKITTVEVLHKYISSWNSLRHSTPSFFLTFIYFTSIHSLSILFNMYVAKRDIGLLVVGFFLPPIAVWAKRGIGLSLLLNVGLTFCGAVPGKP